MLFLSFDSVCSITVSAGLVADQPDRRSVRSWTHAPKAGSPVTRHLPSGVIPKEGSNTMVANGLGRAATPPLKDQRPQRLKG